MMSPASRETIRMSTKSSRRLAPAAAALPMIIGLFLGGCHCPEPPQNATVIVDDEARLKATTTLLETAKAKKAWTEQDQQAFNKIVAPLSFKSRLAYSQQLTGLITSRAIIISRSTEPEPPACACQCLGSPPKN